MTQVTFRFRSHEVRMERDEAGAIWFCAKDVCEVLGYGNTPRTVEDLCVADGVRKSYIIDALGRRQEALFISEGNLYRLMIRSHKPEARPFEAWVCDEVLPRIRQTGAYVSDEAVEASYTPPVMVDDKPLSQITVSLQLVREARQLFGHAHAMHMWHHLGLPIPKAAENIVPIDYEARAWACLGHLMEYEVGKSPNEVRVFDVLSAAFDGCTSARKDLLPLGLRLATRTDDENGFYVRTGCNELNCIFEGTAYETSYCAFLKKLPNVPSQTRVITFYYEKDRKEVARGVFIPFGTFEEYERRRGLDVEARANSSVRPNPRTPQTVLPKAFLHRVV